MAGNTIKSEPSNLEYVIENMPSKYISSEQLSEIRNRITDPHLLLRALKIEPIREDMKAIWALSPFRDETRPSFKLEISTMAWFDHGEGQGGGPLELIQQIHGLNIYQAGQWAMEYGLCAKAVAERQKLFE